VADMQGCFCTQRAVLHFTSTTHMGAPKMFATRRDIRRSGTTLSAAAVLAVAASIAISVPASAATSTTPAPPKYGTSHGTSLAQAPKKSATPIFEYGKSPRPSGIARDSIAQASGSTGRCGYALCLYWDRDEGGAAAGFNDSIVDLTGYIWPNNGTGAGSAIINNAASMEDQGNFDDFSYVDQFYSGASDFLPSQSYDALYNTYNNEASIGESTCYC
jgi:hypothetical protein